MLVKDKGQTLLKREWGALCDPVCLVLEAEGTAPAGKAGRWGSLPKLCGTWYLWCNDLKGS